MQSTWEIMTAGQCNNVSTPEVKRPKTARQVKDAWRAHLKRVEKKFDKIACLDALDTPESRKEKRRMSDSWSRRGWRNVKAAAT